MLAFNDYMEAVFLRPIAQTSQRAEQAWSAWFDAEYELILNTIKANNKRIFDTGGASIQEDWSADDSELGSRTYTLIDTGNLFRSLTSFLVVEEGRESLLWSTDTDYGVHVINRYGNVLGIDQDAKKILTRSFVAFLARDLKNRVKQAKEQNE